MTDAPKKIWAFYAPEVEKDGPKCKIVAGEVEMNGAIGYIRADLAEGLLYALDRIAHATDIYGLEAHAEAQGAEVLAFAHRTICILARDALAKARGEQG